MIRYRISGVPAAVAATCEHPSLADLAWFGPWSATQEADGSVVLTQMAAGWTPARWGPWTPAMVPGRSCALAAPPPDPCLFRRGRLGRMDAATVHTTSRHCLRIIAASAEGPALTPDGVGAGRPAGPYGAALLDLLDRSARGEQPPYADWKAAIRLAIQAGYRLTDDAIEGLGLIGVADLEDYLEAMTRAPKAPAGDGDSSSPAPASTAPA